MFDMGQFRNFMQNPMQYMAQRGMNIPQGVSNPDQIVQHLLNTGQITQQQYNQAAQIRNQMVQKGQMPNMFR